MPLEESPPDNFEQDILEQLQDLQHVANMDLKNLAVLLAQQAKKQGIENPRIFFTSDNIDGEDVSNLGIVEGAGNVNFAERIYKTILPKDIITVPRKPNDKK